MILAALLGFSLQHFLGWNGALVIGLFGGMLLANFVPNSASCPIPGARRPNG